MLLGDSPEDYDKHFILTADSDPAPKLPGRKVLDKAVIASDTDRTKNSTEDIRGILEGTDITGLMRGTFLLNRQIVSRSVAIRSYSMSTAF